VATRRARLLTSCLALPLLWLATPAAAQLELPGGSGPPAPSGGTGPGSAGASAGPLPRPGEPGFGFMPLPDATVRLGTLGFPYGATAAPFQASSGLSLVPSLTVQQSYNDNIRATARNHTYDYITSVIPGLLLNVDTQLVQGTVNYAPNLQYYWRNTDQNRTDQRFNGRLLGTLVPDTLFLDLRGSSAVSTLSGTTTSNTQTTGTRDDRLTTTSYSVSPYLVQRFGGFATAQLGYVFQSVNEDAASRQQLVNGVPVNFNSQDFTSNEVYFSARSGEDFGRLAFLFNASAREYDGSGVLDGAYRNIVTLETRYAITPTIAVLGEVGYQDQEYNSTPRIVINEGIWAVGLRLVPNEGDVVLLRYGHRDGFNSASVDANVGVGVRTRLFARYSDQLSTSAQRAGDLLATTTVDALGNPVDALTGAPVSQPFADSPLSAQGGVLRIKAGTVSLTQVWERDTFTLAATYEDRTPVAATTGSTAQGQTSLYGTFSWARELGPRTSTINSFQYGVSEASVTGDTTRTSFSSALVHQLTETVSGTLTYRLSSRGSNPDNRVIQNVILAGVRKTF
jgi:uncharacterized protein (PEP-CTERM system associated)